MYIGVTKETLQERFHQHHKESRKNKVDRVLTKSMKKYGIENFIIEKIEETDNLQSAYNLEILYIEQYQTYYKHISNKGYNMTKGGPGAKGFVKTPQQRKNQSHILLEYYKNHPEAKERIRLESKNRSKETRRKMAISAQNRIHSKESREKRKLSMTGKVYLHRQHEFYLLDPNGVIHKGKGIRNFCKEHHLERHCISNVIKGIQKQYKGWTLPSVESIEAFETQRLAHTCDISPSPDKNSCI